MFVNLQTMKDWRKNSFYITALEKRVLLLIATLFLLGLVVPRYFAYMDVGFSYTISHKEDSVIQVMELKEKHKQSNFHYKNDKRTAYKPQFIPQKPFNPDTLSFSSWIKFGFSEAQTQSILKFKSFNDGIHSLADLKKIYVIDSAKIAQWDSLLVFSPRPFLIVKINTATLEELEKLKGIGPTLAKRITRYREALGGFYITQQVKEVYGLKPEVFEKIKEHLVADTSKIKQININKVDTRTLSTHPYLNYNQANSIVEYRNQHGFYKKPSDLLHSKLINEEDLLKLKPYLNFKLSWK